MNYKMIVSIWEGIWPWIVNGLLILLVVSYFYWHFNNPERVEHQAKVDAFFQSCDVFYEQVRNKEYWIWRLRPAFEELKYHDDYFDETYKCDWYKVMRARNGQ